MLEILVTPRNFSFLSLSSVMPSRGRLTNKWPSKPESRFLCPSSSSDSEDEVEEIDPQNLEIDTEANRAAEYRLVNTRSDLDEVELQPIDKV